MGRQRAAAGRCADAGVLSQRTRDVGADEPAALRAFELVFLRELGVLPDLALVTLTVAPLAAEARYTLRPEIGLAPDAEGPSGAAWTELQAALAHGSMAALRHACRPIAAALRAPLRSLVHYHLGTARLRTREVWLEMQRLADPATRGIPTSPRTMRSHALGAALIRPRSSKTPQISRPSSS